MYKEASELRREARETLRKVRWSGPVVFTLLYMVLTILISSASATGIGVVLPILTSGAFMLSISIYYLSISRESPYGLETLFTGFNNFIPSLILNLLVSIFTFLWSLLFIIPGIIAALRYSQAFFILAENPTMSARDALNRSKEMMRGHCGRLFFLQLTFIGWAFLCLFTFGIGYLWLIPYMMTAKAKFYDNLRQNETLYTGVVTPPTYTPGQN